MPFHPLLQLFCSALMTLLISACAVNRQTAPPAIASGTDHALLQALDRATDTLIGEAPIGIADHWLGRWWPRAVTVQPLVDATTGQQTAGTREIERRIAERIATRHAHLRWLPFVPDSMDAKPWIIAGRLEASSATPGSERGRTLRLRIVRFEDGRALVHATGRLPEHPLDATPLPRYRDSPLLLTAPHAAPRQPEQWRLAALIEQAGTAYDEGRFDQAHSLYRQAIERGADDSHSRVGLVLAARYGAAGEPSTRPSREALLALPQPR